MLIFILIEESVIRTERNIDGVWNNLYMLDISVYAAQIHLNNKHFLLYIPFLSIGMYKTRKEVGRLNIKLEYN